MLSAKEIRQQFIDYFVKKHQHTMVPSSSVVPHDDPTLLFSNAGMNQFKDVFLGTGKRDYKRAVNTQKCIRAGGKHNDLDDVGKDTYHHTFFEMLGNWSFGDYFKKEAITWAWELLTDVWGLDKSRLHVTVFEGDEAQGIERDDEAKELWANATDIDPSHIHYGDAKDNFWMMGDTGPCGPCTEVHIDLTPDKSGAKLVNAGVPEVIEIWNLVFIQFNRDASGTLTPLPAKHVDTGMGFERITAVLQNQTSNYDTDIFAPIFEAIQKRTGARKYTGKLEDKTDIAYRVIADHIRALTFSLTDGAVPDNTGRGSVVRSILRRAERYGRQVLKTDKPFLHELVPTVVEVMGEAFPELKKRSGKVAETILKEETQFLRTLDRGLKLFGDVVKKIKQKKETVIAGEDAFELHSTYGFFVDITQQMAEEEGMTVDMKDFLRRKKEHEDASRTDKESGVSAVRGELPETDDSPKYNDLVTKATILGWVRDNEVLTDGKLEGEAALLLDKTNFYAEQGGQVGDKGTVRTSSGVFEVTDTKKLGDGILHVGRVSEGLVEVGQSATLEVSPERWDTMRNHTTTHLLNWALRKVLGDHVEQRGSLVDADKTRFDFTHEQALSSKEIGEIERLVNEQIYTDHPVTPLVMPLEDAQKIAGVRAVFGEKYPDPVRVLMIGPTKPDDATEDNSIEFCGGTHLGRTGQAGFFKLVSQERVGGSVVRVTGVTGRGAVETVQQMSSVVAGLATKFNCKPEEVGSRVESLQAEIKKLQNQLKKGAATDATSAADKLFDAAVDAEGAKIICGAMPAVPVEQMRQQIDRLRQKAKSAVVVLGWVDEEKVQLLAGVSNDLTKKVGAGDLIKEIAPVVGGRGGGRKDMAQAGGNDPSKLDEALAKAVEFAREKLG